MSKDRRKKGCPNESCMHHINGTMFDPTTQSIENNRCPSCGAELVFVCAKCHCEIEDMGPSHRICLRCEAMREEKKEKAKEKFKDVAVNAGKAVVGIVLAIGAKVLADGKGAVIKAGTKAAEGAIDAVKNLIIK